MCPTWGSSQLYKLHARLKRSQMPRFGPWQRCVTIGLGSLGFPVNLVTALVALRSRRRLLVQGSILGAFLGCHSPVIATTGLAAINAIGSLVRGLMDNAYGEIIERSESTNRAISPTVDAPRVALPHPMRRGVPKGPIHSTVIKPWPAACSPSLKGCDL